MTTIDELIVDAYGCAGDLSDPDRFIGIVNDAARLVGATIVETVYHRFQPHGLTLCAILKESHLIVSTWPEHDLVVANIFLCNGKMDTKLSWKAFETNLQPKQVVFHSVPHRIFGLQTKKAG